MSRVSYSEDEDYPGQFALWQANCRRSLHGKTGQAVLRDMESALLALPNKRLIAHAVACEGDVCAVGAYLVLKRAQRDGVDMQEAERRVEAEMGAPEDQACDETVGRGIEAGMPRLVAWKLVALNDIEIDGRYVYDEGPLPKNRADEYRYYGGHRGISRWVEATPEERYEKVLAWVRSHLTEESR